MNRRLFTQLTRPFIYIDQEVDERISDIFEIVLMELEKKQKNADEIVGLKILELIILCDRFFNTKLENEISNRSTIYDSYIDHIEEKYKEFHQTGYYAQLLNVHPNVLNAIVKRHSGNSAKKLIETKLVAEAKYLLQQTSLSGKEIAFELGFGSPSYFFRFFKKHTAQSPEQFRSGKFDSETK